MAKKKPVGRRTMPAGTTKTTGRGAKKAAAGRRPAVSPRPAVGIRVRMYRQGLGDCFLITFPKKSGGEFHILIDCGVILGTPNPGPIMTEVVQDILDTTGKHVDVLVATHEHWDHVSGFGQVPDLFKKLKVDRVWLAWTEDPTNATARQLRHERAQKLAALWVGVQHLQKLSVDGNIPPEIAPAAEILSFFGIDPQDPFPDDGTPFAARAAKAADGGKTGAAMTWVRKKIDRPDFWSPGDVIDLTAELGVRVYVLGPPADPSFMSRTLPTKKGHETYEDQDGEAKSRAASRAFMAAATGADGSFIDDTDTTLPFDVKYQIPRADAAQIGFFREHYWGAEGDSEGWRRIDGSLMAGAAEFALQLDSETNNTSLVLAFELSDGRVLLFPGDAQVGNWESWHVDGDKTREWIVKTDQGTRRVTAEALLNKTVLYKVGHHGSHNATLRERGLEMMTDPRLVAMVPVDVHIAHDKKRWGKMPFLPLMSRLMDKTGGQTIQVDEPAGAVPGRSGRTALFVDATRTITVDGPGGKPVTRPLYVDCFVAQ